LALVALQVAQAAQSIPLAAAVVQEMLVLAEIMDLEQLLVAPVCRGKQAAPLRLIGLAGLELPALTVIQVTAEQTATLALLVAQALQEIFQHLLDFLQHRHIAQLLA
jgi:hypothetical protein